MRDFKPAPKVLDIGARTLKFKFTVTAATGAVGTVTGWGVTVTKTALQTGRYTVTLSDAYNRLIAAHVDMMAATATNVYAELLSEAVSTVAAPVLYIQCRDRYTNGADTETAADATIFVTLDLSTSRISHTA
jgi:hypothetical protein